METYDYYVSGIKIAHQVPRFDAPCLLKGDITTFSVNHALSEGPFILIFSDRADLQVSLEFPVPVYLVVRDEISTLQPGGLPVIADTALNIAESFGVLNEKTGLFIPSVFGVKASGQLAFKLEGIPLASLSNQVLEPMIKTL